MIVITVDEFKRLLDETVRGALPLKTEESSPQPFIKGIHELSRFLKVSPARAQKLKNEGVFPYWQDGRTLLFDPEKVRQAMSYINKKGKR